MIETEITHESKYEIWHQCDGWQIWVYVIELNPGELIRRKCLDVQGGRYDEPNRPWPFKREEKLILRRWDLGRARIKGYAVANLFRCAEETRRALQKGFYVKPSYTLEGRLEDAKRRTKRQEKNDQRANSAHDE